jgi:excisionase family DNA binding protein
MDTYLTAASTYDGPMMPSKVSEHLDAVFADRPDMLLRSEAAQILRCREQHISDLVHRGELPAFQKAARQGSKLLIPKTALRQYIERHSR